MDKLSLQSLALLFTCESLRLLPPASHMHALHHTTPHHPLWPQDRTVRLWNPHRGIPIKVYTGHGYDVRDAAVVSDNSK